MKKRLDPLALSLEREVPQDLARRRAPHQFRIHPPALGGMGGGGFDLSPDPRARLLKSSRREDNLIAPVVASALLHAAVIAAFFIHLPPRVQEAAAPPATVALVWQPNPSRRLALEHPGNFKNAPPAEARPSQRGRVAPVSPPRSAPPPPSPQQEAAEPTQAPPQKSANAEQAPAEKQAAPTPKRATRRPSPQTPQFSSNPFANMTNLSLSVPTSVPQTLPGQHQAQMPGPAPPGHASMGSSVDSLDAPNSSPDWQAEMRAWVEARDYYPEAAVAKHEEGISTVEITIDKNGKVTDLQLVGMSGSDRLDDAWLSVFRNRTVPAPTPDMDADNGYTFRATLQYVLVEMAPP